VLAGEVDGLVRSQPEPQQHPLVPPGAGPHDPRAPPEREGKPVSAPLQVSWADAPHPPALPPPSERAQRRRCTRCADKRLHKGAPAGASSKWVSGLLALHIPLQ